MNCHDTREIIHAFVDSELELTTHLDIEHHLQDCSACLRAVQVQQRLAAAMKAAPLYFAPPAGLEQRVRVALDSAAPHRLSARRISWRPLAMAASLLLVAGLAWQLGVRSGG